MTSAPNDSRLLHAIVVVGLSLTTNACGGATAPNVGNDAAASGKGGVESDAESGADAARRSDRSSSGGGLSSAPDAGPGATSPDGGDGVRQQCNPWPCYV